MQNKEQKLGKTSFLKIYMLTKYITQNACERPAVVRAFIQLLVHRKGYWEIRKWYSVLFLIFSSIAWWIKPKLTVLK